MVGRGCGYFLVVCEEFGWGGWYMLEEIGDVWGKKWLDELHFGIIEEKCSFIAK